MRKWASFAYSPCFCDSILGNLQDPVFFLPLLLLGLPDELAEFSRANKCKRHLNMLRLRKHEVLCSAQAQRFINYIARWSDYKLAQILFIYLLVKRGYISFSAYSPIKRIRWLIITKE